MPQNCEHFLKYSTIIPAYLRFIHTEIRRSHRRRLLLEDSSESEEDCSLSQISFWIKKRLQKRCFSVNISKLAKTFFFTEHFWATAPGKLLSTYNGLRCNDALTLLTNHWGVLKPLKHLRWSLCANMLLAVKYFVKKVCIRDSEVDLGLLQHSRWSALW